MMSAAHGSREGVRRTVAEWRTRVHNSGTAHARRTVVERRTLVHGSRYGARQGRMEGAWQRV